ncbi:MAG TPA: IS1595 family transposase [Candidatus Dormibacteraeota bacterium]|nr:IS1595 family transposase [Candidatus Dormibacteraeota bacterium]
MQSAPKTLVQAIKYFADLDNCIDYLANRRWPKGPICPTCGRTDVTYVPSRRLWQCKTRHPKAQFSIKTGTVLEDSPLGLDKWLPVMWMVANCKNGVSSWEIHRSLGVTQKTAWFMLHRIRLGMQDGFYGGKLGSGPDAEVEVDETFIGGKARNMHKDRKARLTGRIDDDKTVVVGFLERGGKVRTQIVTKRQKQNLQPIVREQVQAGAALYTDALKAYIGLDTDYGHQVVDHAVEYVHGRVHTNTLENFWSLLKRGLHGTYVSVEPFHMFRYLDEQMFRFNNRKDMDDSDRFRLLCTQIVGKRLTYAELTAKEDKKPEAIF